MNNLTKYTTLMIWVLTLGIFSSDLHAQRRPGGPAPRPSGTLSSVTGGVLGQNEHLSRNRRSLRFSFGDRGDAGKAVMSSAAMMRLQESSRERAMTWLTKQQKEEGFWVHTHGRVAHTGMAVLCYLSNGDLPADDTPNGKALKKGLDWLLTQIRENGALQDGDRMYGQAIGTLALSEAFNLSKNEAYGEPLEKLIKVFALTQHPESGGWRYYGYPTDKKADTSVTGWVVMAVQSAKYAGVKIPEELTKKMKVYFKSVAGGKSGGAYGYTPGKIKPSTTSIGMYCQQLMGNLKGPQQDESAMYLDMHRPDPKHSHQVVGCGKYHYWFYGTFAMYLHGGRKWADWDDKLHPALIKYQEDDGHWAAAGPFAKKEGDVISTCWAIMALNTKYRCLPILNPAGKGNSSQQPTEEGGKGEGAEGGNKESGEAKGAPEGTGEKAE